VGFLGGNGDRPEFKIKQVRKSDEWELASGKIEKPLFP